MADWNTPSLTTGYSLFSTNLKDRDLDAITQCNNGTPTNTPTGAIKWDTGLNRWNKWSGTAWVELTTTYGLLLVTCTGLNNTGNTTLGDAGADTVTIYASTGSTPRSCTCYCLRLPPCSWHPPCRSWGVGSSCRSTGKSYR